MSIRFVALAMALNSSVSIVAWESGRPIPARAQTEDCVEQLRIIRIRFPSVLERRHVF